MRLLPRLAWIATEPKHTTLSRTTRQERLLLMASMFVMSTIWWGVDGFRNFWMHEMAGICAYLIVIGLLHFKRSHPHPFKVLIHLGPPPGMVPCPRCGGDGVLLNDHGVLRRLRDVQHVSHKKFGNSKGEYKLRSFFSSGERPALNPVECPMCRGMCTVPASATHKTSVNRINPERTWDPENGLVFFSDPEYWPMPRTGAPEQWAWQDYAMDKDKKGGDDGPDPGTAA